MYALGQHLRFALRQLRKAPGFTFTVVLPLALGIGATTAIFSLVEGILLRPLPFSNPDRLVLVGDHLGGGASTSVTAREIGTYTNVGAQLRSRSTALGSAQESSRLLAFAPSLGESLRKRKRTPISRRR
jgi:hypothetical protein